jgi:hypothetical protein
LQLIVLRLQRLRLLLHGDISHHFLVHTMIQVLLRISLCFLVHFSSLCNICIIKCLIYAWQTRANNEQIMLQKEE